jgi:hypothetical protein
MDEVIEMLNGVNENLSALSSQLSRASLSDVESWCDICPDLVEDGFSPSIVSEQRESIQRWLLDAVKADKIDVESLPDESSQAVSYARRIEQDGHAAKASVHLSVSEALEKVLVKPLMRSEIKGVGSIYICWQPGKFGRLKIGCSKNKISKRVKEWNSRCRKPMEVYFPKPGSDEEHLQVSHVRRVEKLVHTELKNCRRFEEMCPGCKGHPIEWFEVSRQLAIAVVRKWMAWMQTAPYEERSCGEKTETDWVLKDEQRRKIKELSQPL